MKNSNYIYQFYYAVTLMLLATLLSCSDDDPRQVPLDVGVLSVSRSEVVIDYDRPTVEALIFTWHAEKTSRVEYKLVFTANGKTDSVNVLSAVSKRFVQAEINRVLLDLLALEVGKQTNVDVFVYGKYVGSTKTGLSNVVTIAVTPARKFPEPPLALLVSKTDVVVDPVNPSGETVTLSWAPLRYMFVESQLTLTAGSKTATFDVSTDVSKEFTNMDLNNILLDKFGVEVGQATAVAAQISGKALATDKIVKSDPVTFMATAVSKDVVPPPYTKLWIVGKSTPKDWDINNPDEMVADPTNIYQFKYNEVIFGEFKIPTATGSYQGDFYMPLVNHPDLSSTEVNLVKGGSPDNKWDILDRDAYKILLNIGPDPSIAITQYEPFEQLYILGDATAAGWDAGNAIAMTADPNDPYVFMWTGELTSTGRSQFIFPVAKDASNTTFFAAPTSGAGLTATQLSFTSTGASINKFKLKEGEDGTYKITINQLKETISIVKQ